MTKASRIALLTLVLGLGACQQGTPTSVSAGINTGTPPAAATGFNTMAQQGQESWVIEGASRNIDATYYLALPEGLQFTVEVPVGSVPESHSAAQEQAWPYIRHAYEHDLYLRAQIKQNGTPVQATRIGVALVQHLGAQHRGHRVAMSIADVEARLGSRQNRK